jgi:hypothetical protein
VGINSDIGNSPSRHVEEVRRLAEVAKVCAEAGLIVLVNAPGTFPSTGAGDIPVEVINVNDYLDTANASTWGGLDEHAESLIKSFSR